MRKSSFLFITAIGLISMLGCNALNDNPVSAEKMNEIRQKEASQRGNFHPSSTPPAGGAATQPGG